MAQVKFGPMVSDARGSVGGTVFSRNTTGAYTRQRVAPVNPSSARQNEVRSFLSAYSQRWTSALTQAQRDAWTSYADNVPLPNKLGDPVTVSGIAMYVRTNALLRDIGTTAVDDAPTEFTVGPTIIPTLSLDEGANEISIDDLGDYDVATDGDINLLLSFGQPQNPGVEFFVGPFRKMTGQVLADPVTFPLGPFSTPFPFSSGQAVFVRSRPVTPDGRVGPPNIQRFLA